MFTSVSGSRAISSTHAAALYIKYMFAQNTNLGRPGYALSLLVISVMAATLLADAREISCHRRCLDAKRCPFKPNQPAKHEECVDKCVERCTEKQGYTVRGLKKNTRVQHLKR